MSLLVIKIETPDDILPTVASLHSALISKGVGTQDRLRLLAAAIDAAVSAAEQPENDKDASLVLETAEDSAETLQLLFVASRNALPTRLGTVRSGPAPLDAKDRGFHQISLARELADSLRAAQELANKQGLIATLDAELEETNRGVMALYGELDDRAEKLRRADELKSRFLSYASHELRTPLNGIAGLVRLLMSGGAQRSQEEVKQLSFIQRAAEELREIVNDLLDLAKVEAGKITVQPTEFSLEFVFGALRGMFRPLLATDDVVLVFADTSAVPAIYSDEAKVAQILRNLISNALKFTEKGEVKVWAELDGATVRISVSDTGLGIPANQLAHIFDEFSQIENPLQRRSKGTGLGLPLCRKLAEILCGEIRVTSELGAGSTFTLVLPLKLPKGSEAALTESPTRQSRSRAKILVVDDVEIDRYLLTQLISTAGSFEVLHSEDGAQGLEAARRELPDLIFLDLNLPRMDGFAVLDQLNADVVTRSIPVYAVTAEKLTEDQAARLRSMTHGILFKEDFSRTNRMHINLAAAEKVSVF